MNPRREPAMYLATIAAFLNLAVVAGIGSLTSEQAALIVAAISAAAGVVTAVMTRPISLGVFTAVVTAGFALFAGFGFEASPELIGGVNAALLAALTWIFRGQVTPVAAAARRTTPRD